MSAQDSRVLSAIYSLPELVAQVDIWRAEGLIIGFTCGAFDLLHAGHAQYLQQARRLCDRLTVAVNSDESIRKYKSPLRPVIHERERMNLVAALRCVDAVILMEATRPATLISRIHPDMYIKGGDYAIDQLKSAGLVESYGGRVEVIPVEHEISSTSIIRRIEEIARYADPEKLARSNTGPLVFLDRDGALIENLHFLKDPNRVRLLDGVGDGLRQLKDQGFRLVVVTNQQGIGLGYFEYADFVAVNSAMLLQLSEYGVEIEKFYYCPHSVADHCECRKPGTKLIERALADFGVSPAECFFIGDSNSDMTAAAKAGMAGILLSGEASARAAGTTPFGEAVTAILNRRQGSAV